MSLNAIPCNCAFLEFCKPCSTVRCVQEYNSIIRQRLASLSSNIAIEDILLLKFANSGLNWTMHLFLLPESYLLHLHCIWIYVHIRYSAYSHHRRKSYWEEGWHCYGVRSLVTGWHVVPDLWHQSKRKDREDVVVEKRKGDKHKFSICALTNWWMLFLLICLQC